MTHDKIYKTKTTTTQNKLNNKFHFELIVKHIKLKFKK